MNKKISVFAFVLLSMTLFFVKDHCAENSSGFSMERLIARLQGEKMGLKRDIEELKEDINERKKIREDFRNKGESIKKNNIKVSEQERDDLKQERDRLRQEKK